MAVQSSIIRPALHRTPATGDLRRHRRVKLQLSGRFMRADRNEYPCTLTDMSVGGASVITEQPATAGERVVVYFEHIGGLEGVVSRQTEKGFAFLINASDYKREKLAAQLMWLLNKDAFPDELGRQHERVGTGGRRTTLKVDDGVVIDVELLDLSASGASVGTPARPSLGSFVVVGKTTAIVRRHHDNGVGLQFIAVQSPEALRENFP